VPSSTLCSWTARKTTPDGLPAVSASLLMPMLRCFPTTLNADGGCGRHRLRAKKSPAGGDQTSVRLTGIAAVRWSQASDRDPDASRRDPATYATVRKC
jgi:hypothetical protein